jgi:hypothetical protein
MTADLIDTKAPIERFQQAGSLQLPLGNFGGIVCQSAKLEPCASEFSERLRYFRVGRHRRKSHRQLGAIGCGDRNAPCCRQHFQNRIANVAKRNTGAGERQRLRIENEVCEPQAQNGSLTENALKRRREGFEVKQRFVDVKDDHRESGHGDLHFIEFPSSRCSHSLRRDIHDLCCARKSVK